jgi:hypothetical protein
MFRHVRAALLGVILGVAPLAGQHMWQPELGIQGGYSHQKLAGIPGNSSTTLIGFPGGNYIASLFSASALYGLIPVADRFAVEPQLTAAQVNAVLTTARIGVRADYAITPAIYASAGGILNYLGQGTRSETQLGLQLAVGYRRHLTGALNGRLEANWVSTHGSDLLPAFNTYSILAGVSTSLAAAATPRRASRAAVGIWEPVIGVAGGYTSAHRIASTSIGGLFFPGSTNGLGSFLPAFPGPPALFAVLPLHGRWAIEPGFDLQNYNPGGSSPGATAATGSVRFDYAVGTGWYGGVGGQIAYVDPAVGASGGILGASLAWGYRFHLAGALGARFETSYSMFARNRGIRTPPVNTLALLLGVLMPLR